jgi:hypothetical protein
MKINGCIFYLSLKFVRYKPHDRTATRMFMVSINLWISCVSIVLKVKHVYSAGNVNLQNYYFIGIARIWNRAIYKTTR